MDLMKKAQGLPITVIIIAAIGILVLIVVAAIFSGQIGRFGRVANECPSPASCLGPYSLGDAKQPGFDLEQRRKASTCPPAHRDLGEAMIKRDQPRQISDSTEFCARCCMPVG